MALDPKSARRGDPTVAALLTWFLPGAGHAYLGQFGLGLALFALVDGLFFLGLQLSNGMTFEFLDPELRSPFAPVLSPEIGNLGGMLWQMRNHGFGPGIVRPFPETIVFGSMLAALSGVLNGLAMCHAHTLARASSVQVAHRVLLPTAAGFVVPGLGHLMQGRRARGLVVFALLMSCFVLGTLLADGSNLSRERHFYYWAGQFGIGLPGMLAELAFGKLRVTSDIPYVDGGLVFGCVAGMLNLLALIDVYGWSESQELGLPLKSSEPESPAPAASKVEIRL
jgi:TM2 domain-containing membrane protein YozV